MSQGLVLMLPEKGSGPRCPKQGPDSFPTSIVQGYVLRALPEALLVRVLGLGPRLLR
jgi:hypothetical protein